jgi:hypothetical protein
LAFSVFLALRERQKRKGPHTVNERERRIERKSVTDENASFAPISGS